VSASQVNHNFMHVPLLLDDDKTQRIYNLPAKLPQCARLMEDPFLLPLLAAMLKEDFILSDISATSIGPHTDGGYWHVDAPLTMLPEPLPDVVLAHRRFPPANLLVFALALAKTPSAFAINDLR
jgi:hypothetical protein